MKKLFSFTPLIACFLFFLLIIFGCKKEVSDTLTPQEEQEAATESSNSEIDAEFTFDDVFDNVLGVNSEVGIGGVGIFGRTGGNITGRLDSNRCFTVTITPQTAGVFPKTVVIDFGTLCSTQNHNRSGKIIIVYSGPLTIPGSSATTTFDNFRIDDFSVQGTHKISNSTGTAGSNATQRQFTVDVTGAKITKTNGDYSQWESHRVTTQTEGSLTPVPQDDIFSIKGTAHGQVKKDNKIYSWNSEITDPLIKKFACHWISKGILKVTRETLPSNSAWTATLDYGNGDCDNKASLTINGSTQQITLH